MENWTEEAVAAYMRRFDVGKNTAKAELGISAADKPMMMPEIKDFESKFKIDPSGCWLWHGAKHSEQFPYGKIRKKGHSFNAHRIAWQLYRGEIPNAKQVLHKCDVPACVNPDHLFLGSQKDNMIDAVAKGRHKNCVFYGETHPMAKLTNDQAEAIRNDKRYLREIANDYRISISQAHRIRRNQSRREIETKVDSSLADSHVEPTARHAPKSAPESKANHPRFRIHVHCLRRRLADPDGLSAKAVLDGLVAGGLFGDDSPAWIEEVSFSQEKSKIEETVIDVWQIDKEQ